MLSPQIEKLKNAQYYCFTISLKAWNLMDHCYFPIRICLLGRSINSLKFLSFTFFPYEKVTFPSHPTNFWGLTLNPNQTLAEQGKNKIKIEVIQWGFCPSTGCYHIGYESTWAQVPVENKRKSEQNVQIITKQSTHRGQTQIAKSTLKRYSRNQDRWGASRSCRHPGKLVARTWESRWLVIQALRKKRLLVSD